MTKPTTQTYTVALVSHTPDHGDGSIRQGDTLTFKMDPNVGLITVTGSRDGEPLAVWSCGRLNPTLVLGVSPAWAASPGPLQAHVVMATALKGKLTVVAETSFEIQE